MFHAVYQLDDFAHLDGVDDDVDGGVDGQEEVADVGHYVEGGGPGMPHTLLLTNLKVSSS